MLTNKFQKWQKRKDFENHTYKVAIFNNELLNVVELNFELTKFNKEITLLEQKCQRLVDQLQYKINKQGCEQLSEIDTLKGENEKLFNYIKELENRQNVPASNECDFDALSRKIRYRKNPDNYVHHLKELFVLLNLLD